jgi:NADP-dependent 3-hydroxy acid dehydrogenase YdfG
MKRLAIVTGATGDIGYAVTKVLLRDGFFVIGIGQDKAKGETLAHEFGERSFSFQNLDVTDEEAVTTFFQSHDMQKCKLYCLVTCAGTLDMHDISQMAIALWKQTINVNLTGTFLFFQNAIRKIRKDGNAAILYAIGSRWGSTGHSGASAYSASKSALRGFIRSVQLDLIGSTIRAILVSPGSVAGNMSDHVDPQNTKNYIDPQQIGNLISFINTTDANVLFDEISMKAYPYDYQI